MRPDAPSGHFKRHLERAIGLDKHDERLYSLKIPGHRKHDQTRDSHDEPVLVPHEVLSEEVLAQPDIKDKLEEAVQQSEWAEVYTNHPIVKASHDPVLPLALYVDGVPVTKNDGLVA
eukprot:3474460-Alexandrium_andersonii.AAC.1